jgi:hypothetical protein
VQGRLLKPSTGFLGSGFVFHHTHDAALLHDHNILIKTLTVGSVD